MCARLPIPQSIAAEMGHVDLLGALASSRLFLDSRSLDGSHALLRALRRRQWDAAELLLRMGSDPNIEQNPDAIFNVATSESPASATMRLVAPTNALHVIARDPESPLRLVSLIFDAASARRSPSGSAQGKPHPCDVLNRHGVSAVGIAAASGNNDILARFLSFRPNLEISGQVGPRSNLTSSCWVLG